MGWLGRIAHEVWSLFVDDIEINCNAARALGMTAVHFVDTHQAVAEITAALD